jgi:hypothetical protein
MRPQELAFSVHGQSSGVKLYDPSTSLKARGEEMINGVGRKAKGIFARGIEVGKEKLGFKKASVQQGAVMESAQHQIQQEEKSSIWRDLVMKGDKSSPALGASR